MQKIIGLVAAGLAMSTSAAFTDAAEAGVNHNASHENEVQCVIIDDVNRGRLNGTGHAFTIAVDSAEQCIDNLKRLAVENHASSSDLYGYAVENGNITTIIKNCRDTSERSTWDGDVIGSPSATCDIKNATLEL